MNSLTSMAKTRDAYNSLDGPRAIGATLSERGKAYELFDEDPRPFLGPLAELSVRA